VTSPWRGRAQQLRWFGVALAMVLVSGCTQVASNTGPSPTHPAPASPNSVAALPCKMPASLRVDQGGNREVLGYLALPSGAITDDPTDSIVKVADFPVGGGGTAPVWGTVTSPQLFGVGLGTYSLVARKWLPAPPTLVAPDLLHYVYIHANGSLRLAAATGSEIPIANPIDLTPLAYTSAGVVLVQNQPAANGLWLLDPTTHAIAPITPPAGTDDWREVTSASGRTLVYGLNSPGVLGAPAPTAVFVASLTGHSGPTTAYTAPSGTTIALIAADRLGGALVVLTGTSPGLVYLDPGTGSRPVTAPAGVVPAMIGPRHHADAHGIWLVGHTGIFLFNASSGFQKIASGVSADVAPGGDCA
jgi:hypothetical protein